MSRDRQVVCLLLFIIFILQIIKSILTANLYTDTFSYDVNQTKVEALEKINLQLKNELLLEEAYTVIASKAAQMGFIINDSPIFLK